MICKPSDRHRITPLSTFLAVCAVVLTPLEAGAANATATASVRIVQASIIEVPLQPVTVNPFALRADNDQWLKRLRIGSQRGISEHLDFFVGGKELQAIPHSGESPVPDARSDDPPRYLAITYHVQ